MGLEKEESRMMILGNKSVRVFMPHNTMRVGTIIKPILQMRKQTLQGKIICPKLCRFPRAPQALLSSRRPCLASPLLSFPSPGPFIQEPHSWLRQ